MRLNSWLSSLSKSIACRNARLSSKKRRRRTIRDRVECLEDRLVLATVTGTSPSFATSGSIAAGTTSLQVAFSENVVGGATASNFELRNQGSDGLLGNGDDTIITLGASYASNASTLSFTGLAEGIYRLTVKETITDVSANALDGDANGAAGGNWVRDFVVGARITALTSPNGFTFDPEFGGFGAGQLVQGTGNAFDGLNRLQVGAASFTPNSSTTAARRVFESAPSSTLSTPPSGVWTTVPGMSATFTTDGTSPARISATVLQLANSNAIGQARFTVDGSPVTPIGSDYQTFATNNTWSSLQLEDYLMLTAGSHTIGVEIWGQSLVVGAEQSYSSLRVELADALPGGAAARRVFESAPSSTLSTPPRSLSV